MERDERVYAALEELGIEYTKHNHPPVYTVEEAKAHWDGIEGSHVKNLFLRNNKGNQHYLVVMEHATPLDLKELGRRLGTGGLSFASERRLEKYLGLSPGSVSIFGILNDANHEVHVIIEEKLMERELINFHPNVNTATLTISTQDLKKFLDQYGNKVRFVRF